MTKEESTHLVFDGKSLVISPDLSGVFQFLMEIEKEVENLLGFENRLETVRVEYLEMLKMCEFFAKKLQENSIDFEYKFSKHPADFVKALNDFYLPIR